MTSNLRIDNLCEQYRELRNIEIIQIHTHGKAKYLEFPYANFFLLISFFVGDNVHYEATECGVVNLFGKSLKQREKALISIAHPGFREALEKEALEWFRGF